MTVRIYRSTDPSAPVLTGQVGTLLTVLDAVLVNGYGALTAAGWTIAYTATNKRQYAMAAAGTGCQLYIDDTGPGAGGAKEARFNGFLTGTAIGTGTGQFPTTSQMTAPSGALVIRKSNTADSTARAWTIIADGHTIYMFIETGDMTSPLCAYPFMFGDFFSYSSGDVNNCMLIGRVKENQSLFASSNTGLTWPGNTSVVEVFTALTAHSNTFLSDTIQGHYAVANYNGVGGSLAIGKHSDTHRMGQTNGATPQMGYLGVGPSSSGSWTGEFAYPNGPDGGLYIAPIWIHHNSLIRGYMKGLWCPLQHTPLGHNDTYSGTGNLSGKSFIAQNILGATTTSPATAGNNLATQVHIETSNTWT